MVTLQPQTIQDVVEKLIRNDVNHRQAVFDAINTTFLQDAIKFFGEVAKAKLLGEDVEQDDWYVAEMIEGARGHREAAINAGIPLKTIENIHGTGRSIVVDAAVDNHTHLLQVIDGLMKEGDPYVFLTIKMGQVGVDLTLTESLIVVNSLAVRRHHVSAGFWSALGNRVEDPLMDTLCELFHVPADLRDPNPKLEEYQVDYRLKDEQGKRFDVEVKLNGKGNPESVKAGYAGNIKLVVATHVSKQNRTQLEKSGIEWVCLDDTDGYRRFGRALRRFGIPHRVPDNLDELDRILNEVVPLT